MIKRQDETGALSCRISCCPPSVKRGGYLLPSFHPVPSSGGGPGNSFGEVAFIWRQNILIYLKRKVLTMHWMYIYLSVGDHNEYISIGLDRSQPLFYFVPQEKWFSQSSWLDYGRDDTSNKSNTAKSSIKTSVSVSRLLSYLFWYQNGILYSMLYDRQHTRTRQYNDKRLLSDIISYCAIFRLKGKCNSQYLKQLSWCNVSCPPFTICT